MAKYLERKDLKSIRRWIRQLEDGNVQSENESAVLKALQLPYESIGAGKHRIVFDLENGYVLKVAREVKGIICNNKEADLYHRAPSSLKKHLCKIVDSGHGWVVMKKLNRPVPNKNKYKKQASVILERFAANGIRISDVVSRSSGNPKKANLRLNKEKELVIIDYANVYPVTC